MQGWYHMPVSTFEKIMLNRLNHTLQFRARQQTAHLQTILASMQRDALKSRVIVMLNSEQC